MFSVDCDIVAKATHTEVVEYRDLLLLQTCKIIEQMVEMISEAQRTVLKSRALGGRGRWQHRRRPDRGGARALSNLLVR